MPPVRSSAAALPAALPGLGGPAVDGPPVPAQPFGAPADAVPALGARARRHLHAVPELALDFDAAVRALTPRLQRYAVRRLGDRHEAEELVQEALLRAYQHRDELRTEDDVAAWATCVTGRLVIDRLRVRGRSTPVADLPEGSRAERDTADVVVARDEARLALDALDAMPPRQAAVLWAREVEGQGYDEIGRRFSMTEPAVRSLLTRARKALRKEYEIRGGTLPGAGLALLAPWASGTGWLERLRNGLLKGGAPAALGVLAAGVVTGALVLPATSSPAAPAAAAVTVTRVGSPAVVDTPPAPAREVAAAPAAAAPPAPAAPAAERGLPARVLDGTGVDDTCLGAASAGAGGADCAPEPPASTLTLVVPDAPVPAGVRDDVPTVQTNAVECERLPRLPMTECDPAEDPAREDS